MDFAKIIDDSILNNSNRSREGYIGASGIGRACSRAIWYDLHEAEGIPLTASEERIMETGRRLEKMIVDYILAAGFIVDEPNAGNDYLKVYDKDVPFFKGHMDGILHINKDYQVILEIKTAKHERYEKYIKDCDGVKYWSPLYYAQIQSYMGMTGMKQALFCVINKNNCKWRMEWVNFDDIFYHEMKIKALAISTVDEPPAKINQSPWYYICQKCRFKKICHAEVKNE